MDYKELPAFANPGSDQGPGSSGLTKKEYFAAIALQGLLAAQQYQTFRQPAEISNLCNLAVWYANTILEKLETNGKDIIQ